MKIALLISGHIRSFKDNIENIKNNVIQDYDVDIYIHYSVDSKYNNNIIDVDQIKKILNPKIILCGNDLSFNVNVKINAIYNQNYKLYALNEIKNNIAKIENINYDCVVKIRPDIQLLEKLQYINLDTINIPIDTKIDHNKLSNFDENYMCDIIAFGNNGLMNDYCNMFLSLEDLIVSYGHVNETLTYYYLQKYNYNLIEINYYVLLSTCNTIAITGDSGAGKTTLSNIIHKIYDDVFVLECDRYHKWERGNDNWKLYTHLNPEANYLSKMHDDVFDLKIGKDIYQVDYDHKNGKFTDQQKIESKSNIIVCGLHSLYLPKNICNLNIYIDINDNIRIPWKIKRDMKKRGYTKEKIYEQIINRKNDYNKYILPQRDKADIIINYDTEDIFSITCDIDNYDPKIQLAIMITNNYQVNLFDISEYIALVNKTSNHKILMLKSYMDYETVISHIIKNITLCN